MTPCASGDLKRGEVYMLDFSPASGPEMAHPHPCVIVRNDVGNQHSALTIVVAITSNLRVGSLPIGVRVGAGTAGLTKDSVIHCGHVYTVDKNRIGRRLGQLPADLLAEVDRALRRALELNP